MLPTAIEHVRGRAVSLPGDDIDTDRIIPARYMKVVTFDGLGERLFYDVRFSEAGERLPHPLNEPSAVGAMLLIVGSNFGCGSSREHAPQAIRRAGFTGLVGESFAEIFFGNATQLGIACVTVAPDDRKRLAEAVERSPEVEVQIDLKALQVRHGDLSVACTIRDGARQVLLSGRWDPLEDLLAGAEAVGQTAQALPYFNSARSA